MKKHSAKLFHGPFPIKATLVAVAIVSGIIMLVAFRDGNDKRENNNMYGTASDGNGKPENNKLITANKDSIESVKAFMKVYTVLISPRCMNCHPAGDAPLQGDDSHVHTMNVVRGQDGKGMYAVKCSNCHQPTNVPGLHTPPGNPKWQLPPADMKMVFQGRSARELALQIMNYNQNGHKDKAQLIEHVKDTLVKSAWNMGEGRTPPPMTYTAFVSVWNHWIKKGGYAPK